MPTSKSSTPLTVAWSTPKRRLRIDHLVDKNSPLAFQISSGSDVVQGLTQTPKVLPPKYFYDDQGSQLFEQICELPEYYPTRTETAILLKCAAEVARLTGPCELVELGSGSSTKTRILLDAYQQLGHPLYYLPIDVSGGILEQSAYELLRDYQTLQIRGLVSTYELALATLESSQLPARMICFLGSTLGNLNPTESNQFFTQITAALQLGEYFLLGIDLNKPQEILEAAYNDSQGITAAFNLNMLHHLNHRFQGDFDCAQFEHSAFYNSEEFQIEMHLKSLQPQAVTLEHLNLTIQFEAGETVRTEISRKFDLLRLESDLKSYGLEILQTWTDEQQWFGVLLCQLNSRE
ncbi:MAG: L-histidine N(alpha)-methyltransferase [Microcoleaceae cyanobacterium]